MQVGEKMKMVSHGDACIKFTLSEHVAGTYLHTTRNTHTNTHRDREVVYGCHTGDRKSLFLQRLTSSILAAIALPLTPASIHVCGCSSSSRGWRFSAYLPFVTQLHTLALMHIRRPKCPKEIT